MEQDQINFAESWTKDQAIANLQQTEDSSLRYYAAWWIGRFQVRDEVVIQALVEALKDQSDRSPDGGYPLRRNAAKALGKLGNIQVVPALIACFECEDYYVRESAAQALEMLGDSRAIPPLMKLLEGGGEKAKQMEGKPYLIQPYEAIIEALGTLKAIEAKSLIETFLEHFVPKVKYAAIRAMYQLTKDSFYGEKLVQALQGDDLQLRRAALMDIGAVGYVEGASAIAQTLAENSLKLISLKGLLEYQLNQDNNGLESLSDESIHLMELMDSLL
jgi:phycocyanobilin lyase subunit alpha